MKGEKKRKSIFVSFPSWTAQHRAWTTLSIMCSKMQYDSEESMWACPPWAEACRDRQFFPMTLPIDEMHACRP